MLDQPFMTDLIEANSMGHEPNLIDIYSVSFLLNFVSKSILN